MLATACRQTGRLTACSLLVRVGILSHPTGVARQSSRDKDRREGCWLPQIEIVEEATRAAQLGLGCRAIIQEGTADGQQALFPGLLSGAPTAPGGTCG